MPFLIPIGAAVATTVGATGAAATLVSAATVGALGFGIAKVGSSLLGGLLGGGETPALPDLPASPSQADAEAASRAEVVSEQRAKLRGSRTNLTGGSLLAPLGQTTQKTLLGA